MLKIQGRRVEESTMTTSRGSFLGTLGFPVSVCLFLFWSSFGFAQGFKVIHVCGGSDAQPYALIQNPGDGFLYGTSHGGNGFGSVFKMDTSGNVTIIYSFAGPPGDGRYPDAGLYLNSDDGLLYGTTYAGGADDAGTVFKMDTSGGSYVSASLPLGEPGNLCEAVGSSPYASFFKANDGNFYIPMSTCGLDAVGTVDQISTGLSPVELANFPFLTSEFITPQGHLVQGSDNLLYGTANANPNDGGMPVKNGGIYRLPLGGGAIQIVHDFAYGEGDYVDYSTPLCLASDGKFYGTTPTATNPDGSVSSTGTIYRVGTDGSFSLLHTFSQPEGPDGCGPQAGLVQASDGYLYGSTAGGGSIGFGTVFRIDTSGNYKFLFDFADMGFVGGTPASNPGTELVQGPDGRLYGATQGVGSIYTIDLTQTIVSLTPNSGPASGGTAVTITGSGFVSGAAVYLAGAPVQQISVPDSTHIDVTSQAFYNPGPGTIGNVIVTLPDTTVIVQYNGWFYDFLDVPTGSQFHDYIRKILQAHITAGCGGGDYCPGSPVTRAQMAVFLLKAEHGSTYQPPACTGVFGDVPCPSAFADWIEELAAEGITGGCGGGDYCPGNPVTRAQMAVFLLKTEHGSGYAPPACAGIFQDVACPSPFADWIEQLYAQGVTGGCAVSPLRYCPSNPVNRGQMAVFLSKTFNLP